MIIRECEVIIDLTADYDGEQIEVTCGRVAIQKLHGWWMCDECLAETREAERRRRRSRLRPITKAHPLEADDVAPASTTRRRAGAA